MVNNKWDRLYEAAMHDRERMARERLLVYDPSTSDYMNNSLNTVAAAETLRQLEELQQQKTRGSRETTRRNSLLLLTKKGR